MAMTMAMTGNGGCNPYLRPPSSSAVATAPAGTTPLQQPPWTPGHHSALHGSRPFSLLDLQEHEVYHENHPEGRDNTRVMSPNYPRAPQGLERSRANQTPCSKQGRQVAPPRRRGIQKFFLPNSFDRMFRASGGFVPQLKATVKRGFYQNGRRYRVLLIHHQEY